MNISVYETSKLLKGNQTYNQLGFSMLLARLRNLYAQDQSEVCLKKCTDEINIFINRFEKVMAKDIESILKLIKADVRHHLLTFDETSQLIKEGKVLHISASEILLKKLPKGNWIGGSTEIFMTEEGGLTSDKKLLVSEYQMDDFQIKTYDVTTIENVASDAFEDGFSILLIPFDSDIHIEYAKNARIYPNLFIKNIVGWITGTNPNAPEQTPIAVNGAVPEVYTDKAVVLHLKTSEDREIEINIINTFEPDERSPILEFTKEGFTVEKCLVDGKETVLSEYLIQNHFDTKSPIIGDYYGNSLNVTVRSIGDGIVYLFVPVFEGVKYRMGKPLTDYSAEFTSIVKSHSIENVVFSCNCLLNFVHGKLEGKKTEGFVGPITFGEIAYQLVSQTLVYLTIKEN